MRFSFGSAVAPPYLGALVANTFAPRLCGGFFNPCPQGQTVAVSQVANPGLQAETSFGYDLGGDLRLRDRLTVITADLYLTNLHNQLVRSTTSTGPRPSPIQHRHDRRRCRCTRPGTRTSRTPATRASELGIRRDPRAGFGYPAAGRAAARVSVQPLAGVLRRLGRTEHDEPRRRSRTSTSARTRPSRTRRFRTRKATARSATARARDLLVVRRDVLRHEQLAQRSAVLGRERDGARPARQGRRASDQRRQPVQRATATRSRTSTSATASRSSTASTTRATRT